MEGVYAELNNLLLEEVNVGDFLRRLAELAAALVPGTRCVITLRRDDPAAGIDPITMLPDEVEIPGRAAARSDEGGLSVPLVVRNVDIGVLRLFARSSRVFTDAEVERVHTFGRQAALALMLRLRQSDHLVLDDQLQEAFATRAVIDQALGVLMHARRISAHEAFEVLRDASQKRNLRVSVIAAEVIQALTGHPPEPPRPLSDRRTAFPQDPTP
jgi:hypothetical protein